MWVPRSSCHNKTRSHIQSKEIYLYCTTTILTKKLREEERRNKPIASEGGIKNSFYQSHSFSDLTDRSLFYRYCLWCLLSLYLFERHWRRVSMTMKGEGFDNVIHRNLHLLHLPAISIVFLVVIIAFTMLIILSPFCPQSTLIVSCSCKHEAQISEKVSRLFAFCCTLAKWGGIHLTGVMHNQIGQYSIVEK